jgi:hypothetical protein
MEQKKLALDRLIERKKTIFMHKARAIRAETENIADRYGRREPVLKVSPQVANPGIEDWDKHVDCLYDELFTVGASVGREPNQEPKGCDCFRNPSEY